MTVTTVALPRRSGARDLDTRVPDDAIGAPVVNSPTVRLPLAERARGLIEDVALLALIIYLLPVAIIVLSLPLVLVVRVVAEIASRV